MTTKTTNTPSSPPPQPIGDTRVLIARISWFFLGPAIIFLLAFQIVRTGSGWATRFDAMFFIVLALIVLCRWYELRSGKGQDSFGNSATLDAFRPFLFRVLPIGLVIWALANVLLTRVEIAKGADWETCYQAEYGSTQGQGLA
ncbi:MAG: hypothetical protein HZA46_22530 [Planctomycetales bacterium]|nr:hypothetical protein [Planctomycetales bacterium]